MRRISISRTKEDLLKQLITPSSQRHFLMYEALRKGATVEEIHEITKIKHYFMEQMKELVEEEECIDGIQRGVCHQTKQLTAG